RFSRDWSSDVCSSDLAPHPGGNALENRVVFEAPARDGAPRLGDDVVVGMVATQLRLLKAWMQFYLVDDRQNARLVEQVLQSYGVEIADTDRFGQAGIAQLDQGFPRLRIQAGLRCRPVNQV